MNRKDLGKYLSNFFNFGESKPLSFIKTVVKPTPYKRKKRSSKLSGIPTNQGIRIAQNRKNNIAGKKRKAAKRVLLMKRKMKNDSQSI
ncbi:hypothetical protein LCGC14_0365110 [marine sediment metagenome]|uniref:Uncharacterized protein n=1 Tax=marine sediment metagenome TaxID=412755 RepID=A0A0F9TCS9_9ZZZZ